MNQAFQEIITDKKSISVLAISDIHADTSSNLDWVTSNCQALDSSIYSVIVVAGDIGSDISKINEVFDHLVTVYDLVCYVPGNHEAWVKSGQDTESMNSIQKLNQVVEEAVAKGVRCSPTRIVSESQSVFIFPMHGWYHASWDTEPEIVEASYLQMEEKVPFVNKWSDFSRCVWPTDIIDSQNFKSTKTQSTALAEYYSAFNDQFLCADNNSSQSSFGSPYCSQDDFVISFSHYLPRQELCPEKRFLLEPMLSKVIGSDFIEKQIRRLRSHMHIFGHTHIPMDLTLDNIRYIQWPLGYYRERSLQCAPIHNSGPLLIYDSSLGSGVHGVPANLPSESTTWTKYYQENNRNPECQELAPWLAARIKGFLECA